MDITLRLSRYMRLAQRMWPRWPFHQDLPLLEVRHLPPLFAQHSLRGRVTLIYCFMIQDFGDCTPFFLHAFLSCEHRQQAITFSTAVCNTVTWVHRHVGWTRVVNVSLTLWFLSFHSQFVHVSELSK